MLAPQERVRDVARYNSGCLIGNWNEDRELQRTMLRDLLCKKDTGTLRLDTYGARMQTTLAETEMTRVVDDPYLHFGDVVQLVHLDTGCVLAADPSDRVGGAGDEACSATAAPDVRAPCARNTLVLLRYRPPRGAAATLEPDYPDSDDAVHYGQKVRVALHPAATGQPLDREGGPRPLCLFSKPVSTTHAAKYSRAQLVAFTSQAGFDAVWQVVAPDPAVRAMSEGVEVALGAPLLLVHCGTQKPLCLEAHRVPNDYGMELEVSARAALGHGLKLAMEQMSQGIAKGFLPKGEQSDNYFTFVGGSRVEQLPEPSPSTSGAEPALRELLAELLPKPGALSLLERKLVLLESPACLLPEAEFVLVLRQVGCSLSESGASEIVAAFSPGRPGFIDCAQLRKALRAAIGH